MSLTAGLEKRSKVNQNGIENKPVGEDSRLTIKIMKENSCKGMDDSTFKSMSRHGGRDQP